MTRNERKRLAKARLLAKDERLNKALIGKQRDYVFAIVRDNLSNGLKTTVEERAWHGRGVSSCYSGSGAPRAQPIGRGKTCSVFSEGMKRGRVIGKASDWTN